MLLVVVFPLACGALGAWLPRAFAALLRGGWAALATIPWLSQGNDVPKWARWLQLVGMGIFTVPTAVFGSKAWRRLALKWRLATEAEIADFEKHAR